MAEWAKKLHEGLSFQINISIPLSATLSIYDDVISPSVLCLTPWAWKYERLTERFKMPKFKCSFMYTVMAHKAITDFFFLP